MGVVKPLPSKQSQRAVSSDRRSSRSATPSNESTHRFKLSSMSDESSRSSKPGNSISRSTSIATLPDGNFAIGMPFVVGAVSGTSFVVEGGSDANIVLLILSATFILILYFKQM
jgi:hypothetical protein